MRASKLGDAEETVRLRAAKMTASMPKSPCMFWMARICEDIELIRPTSSGHLSREAGEGATDAVRA